MRGHALKGKTYYEGRPMLDHSQIELNSGIVDFLSHTESHFRAVAVQISGGGTLSQVNNHVI